MFLYFKYFDLVSISHHSRADTVIPGCREGDMTDRGYRMVSP